MARGPACVAWIIGEPGGCTTTTRTIADPFCAPAAACSIRAAQVGHYAMGGERPELIEQHPQPKVQLPAIPGCADQEELCSEWVEAGECERNPTYMIGSRSRPGKCVASCKRCDLMTDTGAEGTQDAWKKQQAANGGGSRRNLRQ